MAVRCVTKRFSWFDIRSGVGIASLVRTWRKHVPNEGSFLTSSLEHPHRKHHRWGRKKRENLTNSIVVERHKIVRSSCATELTWETISIKQLAGAFSILLMMAEASPAIVWRFCFTDEYAMFALGVWPQLASYWNSQHANENSSHTFFISTQLTFLWIK